jgi:hypothetical protein
MFQDASRDPAVPYEAADLQANEKIRRQTNCCRRDNVRTGDQVPPMAKGTDRGDDAFPNKRKELTMAERSRARPAGKTTTRKKRSTGTSATRRAAPRRWSQRVTKQSDALDLDRGVFKLSSARRIAASLKRSAERSKRRKAGAYRSALSMLTFYINRAGKNLPKAQRDRLQRAKDELKRLFGRE